MSYTLIVIDMQHSFEASRCEETQHEVAGHISNAMRDGANIMFVEYYGNGPTLANLLILCCDYDPPSWCVVTKWDNGGGAEVDAAMGEGDWNKDLPLKVCGVNLSACVKRTVNDLVNLGYDDIELLWHACNDPERTSNNKMTQEKYRELGVVVNGLCLT